MLWRQEAVVERGISVWSCSWLRLPLVRPVRSFLISRRWGLRLVKLLGLTLEVWGFEGCGCGYGWPRGKWRGAQVLESGVKVLDPEI